MKTVLDILLQLTTVTYIKRLGHVSQQILVQFFSSQCYLFTTESGHLSSFEREIKNPLTTLYILCYFFLFNISSYNFHYCMSE
jgi:hypothetical protein